jgi:hypothetical protein
VVDLVALGRLALDPLLTRRIDLAGATEATAGDPLPGDVKLMLTLSA